MTLGTTLYSIWHAVNGKQSVAAAHLQSTATVADLPYGRGPVLAIPEREVGGRGVSL